MSNQIPQQIRANAVFQRASVDTFRSTVDSVIDATEKSVQFCDDSINAFVHFNTHQIESWFNTSKKA
ncbi:MAG: conserved hypothetical protein [Marine Group I thaumarchaeote]|nr:MAG: conserved hypothetical protein [Marine Group I thaumarchaeote]